MKYTIEEKEILDALAAFFELDFGEKHTDRMGILIFKNLCNLIEQKNNSIVELGKDLANANREHEKQLDTQLRCVEEITRKDAWCELAERLKNYIKERKIKYIGIATIDKIKEEMLNCEGWEK